MSTFRALNTLRSAARSALQTAPRRAASGVPTGYVPYHPVNKVGSNMPFDYNKTTRFTVGFVSLMTLGWAVPFVACAWQLQKAASS